MADPSTGTWWILDGLEGSLLSLAPFQGEGAPAHDAVSLASVPEYLDAWLLHGESDRLVLWGARRDSYGGRPVGPSTVVGYDLAGTLVGKSKGQRSFETLHGLITLPGHDTVVTTSASEVVTVHPPPSPTRRGT